MVEDQFFIYMAVDEFVVEFRVEDRVDLLCELCFGGEDGRERNDVVVLLITLLLETFWPEQLCVGEGFVPGPEEDVVLCHIVSILVHTRSCREDTYLEIRRSNVLDFSHRCNSLLDCRCESNRRENSYTAILESHECSATSDLYPAESRKWY